MINLSIDPEKNELPGPFAKQRTTSAWPARVAMMPRFSKEGNLHILMAWSSQAVRRTCRGGVGGRRRS